MENHKNQEQLDAFAKKFMKEIPLESPSKDFIQNIMSALSKEKKSKIKYVPLITWKTWSVAAMILLGLFFIPTEKSENSVLGKLSFDFKFSDVIGTIPSFDGIAFSDLTIYAFLLFAVMMSVQIFYLKGYFTKRYL